jgi:AraC-like DNA-binding protein
MSTATPLPARRAAGRAAGRRGGPSHHDQRTVDLARAAAHISARCTDPRLTPVVVADELGVSLRSLQRIFEDSDLGVAGHIAHARLDHALELLRCPRLAHLPAEALAPRAGYARTEDLVHAVVAATGLTPCAYRARILDGPLPDCAHGA